MPQQQLEAESSSTVLAPPPLQQQQQQQALAAPRRPRVHKPAAARAPWHSRPKQAHTAGAADIWDGLSQQQHAPAPCQHRALTAAQQEVIDPAVGGRLA